MNTNNVVPISDWKSNPGKPVRPSTEPHPDDIIEGKIPGGEPPMKNDYVTHEELNHAVDNLSNKIDLLEAHIDQKFEANNAKFESVNTKFSDMKVWFLGIVITVILSGLFFK